MNYEIINLTLPVVLKEIDEVLEDYPEYPYQVAFSLHKLRQKLIAHVLSQIPNQYTVIEDTQQLPVAPNNLSSPLKQRLHREMVIRGSILHILRENADWISHQISHHNKSECELHFSTTPSLEGGLRR